MTQEASLQLIEQDRAERFGCDPDVLRRPGVTVVPYAGEDAAWFAARVIRNEQSCAVIVPRGFVRAAEDAAANRSIDDVCNPTFLDDLFGPAIVDRFRHSWIGYIDAEDFVPFERPSNAWRLDPGDRTALRQLRTACAADDWEDSGIVEHHDPVFGAFKGDELVAAASWDRWAERIRHVGVITHPAHRRSGHGAAVASAITEYGLKQGHILQWRTRMTNSASRAIAVRLGYQKLTEAIGVRLSGE
jgi:RimJ/RimL family protein N-acetyltransferase